MREVELGVTIHYSGTLRDDVEIGQLLNLASEHAERSGWQIQRVPSQIDEIIRELVLLVHPDCEPLGLRFNEERKIEDWVKTQFAGAEIHTKIVEFFLTIKPFFRDLTIEDEGEFWVTNDRDLLQSHMDSVSESIFELLEGKPNSRVKIVQRDGRIVDIIQ